MQKLARLLKRFHLFDEVFEEDLIGLAKYVEVIKPGAGDYIIYEGKFANKVFFLDAGNADVFKQIGARQVRIDTLQPGDYFGEIGIVLNCPATATVRAREGVVLFAIPAEIFKKFIERHRSVFFKIFKTTTERLSSTNILQLRHLIDELSFFYNKFLDVQKIWYFLPMELVLHTLRGELTKAKEGRLENISVMFLDLRHYTFFAEIHTPVEVLQTLNAILGEIAQIVIRHNGSIDKFIGDGLLAIFSAEESATKNAANALSSALESVRFLKEFNLRRYRTLEEEFYTGIGINSGPAVLGNVGIENMMMNFTAIGDTVNVAARICSMTGNNSIAFTESTHRLIYRRLKGLNVEKVENVELRGRKEPVTIYRIVNL